MNKLESKVFVLIAILFVVSCKTAGLSARKKTNILRSSDKVIGLTFANNVEYKTAVLKANVLISDGNQKLSFKANIRFFRDSIVWSSLSLMGIAGAKTLITSDSFQVINYREKKYISEPIEKLEYLLNSDILSTKNLQKIMIGDWFFVADFDKYRLKFNDTNYVVSTLSERRIEKDWMERKLDRLEKKIDRQEERNEEKAQETLEKKTERKPRKYEGIALETQIDPYILKVSEMRVIDYLFESELTTSYTDFRTVDNYTMPFHVVILIEGQRNLNIEIEYYKISLDEEITVPFSIPEKYERSQL